MVRRDPAHGYDTLTAESFLELSPGDLEALVRELVGHELAERQASPFDVEGPPRMGAQGCDLRVELTVPPTTSRAEYERTYRVQPLTFDTAGVPFVYSVKSGANWATDALEEARTGGAWAVDALARGGHFVLVTSGRKETAAGKGTRKGGPKKKTAASRSPALKRAKKGALATGTPASATTFLTTLTGIYGQRAAKDRPAASDLSGYVHVVDANDLRDYLRNARPAISAQLLAKLGLVVGPELSSLDEWLASHQKDSRPVPFFEWDDARQKLADQMIATLRRSATDRYSRALWLISPPGVGKTRLVVEALRRAPDIAARTYATTDASFAERALRDHRLLKNYRDAVLVVDDCSEDEVLGLHRAFGAANKEMAGSILIITAMAPAQISAQAPKGLARLDLDPMDSASTHRLVERETGWDAADPRISMVAALTSGYPWFTILVSKELADDPARGAPRSVSDAVDLALYSSPARDFDEGVRRNGAALYIIMMTEGMDLETLDAEDRAETLGVTEVFAHWPEVLRAIRACGKRGLLRPGPGGAYRYVTPAILELEIAKRFLRPLPGGGSPRMKKRYHDLLDRLERLGFDRDSLTGLAQPILARLCAHPPGLAGLRASAVSPRELVFAATYLPAPTAAALRRHVDAAPIDELRMDVGLRRPLMFALETASGRRDTFVDVEAIAFRLACAENEHLANNATATWAGLFEFEHNATYRTFDERLPSLVARLHSAEASARLVALSAPEQTLRTVTFRRAVDEVDGPIPQESPDARRRARITMWTLAIELASDRDESVATRSGEVIAKELRGAIRSGVFEDVSGPLTAAAATLPERPLRRLREAAELAAQHDLGYLQGTKAVDAWSSLARALSPRSFSGKLRQRVGAYGPVATREDPEQDRLLARDGLAPPSRLLEELDWLAGREAVRRVPFAIMLGREDETSMLFESMLERAAAAPELVAAYLLGHRDAGRGQLADGAIERLHATATTSDAAAIAIWRAQMSPRRFSWFFEDVRAGRLSPEVVDRFAVGGWQRGMSEEDVIELAKALLANGTGHAAAVALDGLMDRIQRGGSAAAQDLLPTVFECASRAEVEGHGAYVWERAANHLLQLGDGARVARCAVVAIQAAGPARPRAEVLEVLRQAAQRAPRDTWSAIAHALDPAAPDAGYIAVACREARLSHFLPPPAVRAWVGQSIDRGMLVADLVSMHEAPELPELARQLIVRFGAEGKPASHLRAELHSTPRTVPSIARFYEEQRERARRWLADEEPRVRRFAEICVEGLDPAYADAAAREEYERRRWGT